MKRIIKFCNIQIEVMEKYGRIPSNRIQANNKKGRQQINQNIRESSLTKRKSIPTENINNFQSTISKYQRNSNRGPPQANNRNKDNNNINMKMKPANASKQFKKYLLDTQNVFYQERQEAFFLNLFDKFMPLILKVFVIFLVFSIALTFVQPYDGYCPSNADCGVFIHCHRGFQLKDEKCYISQAARNQAKELCISAIDNLKQMFGNLECEQNPVNIDIGPTKQIYEIITEYGVDSRATESEIYVWFQNQTNQQQHKFVYDQLGIRPLSKSYSITCRLQLFVDSPEFVIISISVLIILFLSVILLDQHRANNKAKTIYQHLKQKIEQSASKEIVIDHTDIYKKIGVQVTSRLWNKVQKLRYTQQQIVYFEDEYLHWIKL